MGHPTPSTDALPPSALHSSPSASATAAPDIAATPPPQPPLPVSSDPHALHDPHADVDADDLDDNPPIVDGIDGDDDPQHVHYGGGDDSGAGGGTDYASSLTTSALHALPSTTEAQADQHMSSTDGHTDEAEISTSTVTGTTPLQDHEIAAQPVHPTDLAAFSELFARFHTRIEKASAGRKYRPLRDAWDAAADEIARASDRIHLPTVSDLVVDALRLGCESGKIVIVDACLDCIHRLFEYGHLGAAGESPTSSDKSSMNNNDNSNIIALDRHHGTTLDVVVNIVCACLEVKDEDVYLRMVQTLLTAATRTKSGLHQSTLLAAVRTIYNIFLNARMPGTRTTARVSLTQILNLVFSRMEAESTEDLAYMSDLSSHQQQQQQPESKPSDDGVSSDTNATPEEKGVNVPDPSPAVEEAVDGNNEFVSVLQRDAYLLFRALCKLSAKENIEVNTPDHVGIRSKMLSLELIRILIDNSGPAFRSGDRFVYALRQYLARSLLINCTWNSAEVMEISFDIFETLLRKDTLRRLLKSEIRVMFETVVFRFLESPTAGLMRKRRVLILLNRLSADRQTMADLFLNYDCDIESPKIFERIVNAVSTTAQSKMPLASTSSDLNHANPAELNVDLRIVALSAVVQVVRSLREWSAPLETEKERTKADGSEESAAQIMHSAPDDEISPSSVAHVSSDDIAIKTDVDDARASLKGLTDSTTLKSLTDSATIRLRDSIVGIISEGSDLDTTRFEEALKAKRDAAEGIKLFNTKPKRGIDFLVKNGRIKEEPESIAKFLHKTESLDAAMIGEYIGDGGAFHISVMHAYTDMYDFTGMTFDGALRLHLSGFRLPGEAQKIDRIMEKFASRYCECNPDIFANADAAYVLAYSCIMLHTDAHNTTIKNKMSKDEFIRNNRGINDGGDLDPIFLGKLYERITTTEIRLSSTKRDSTASSDGGSLNASAAATAAAMDPAQRARQFEQESERLLAQTKVLFTRKGRQATQEYTYYSATNVHHARLMFGTAWYPILAAVSLNLEEASTAQDNNRGVPLCLEGFRHGIAISSLFSMGTAKNAFVSSLAKFTHLNSISEMRPKNVECVRMILAIAANEGNNLGEQWVLIVRAVSILEQIRAVASGNPEKYLLQNAPLVGIGSNIRNGFDNNTGQDGDSGDGAKTLISMASAPAMSSPRATAGVPVVSGDTFRRMSTSRSTSSSSGNNKADGSAQKIDPKAASLAKTVPEGEIDRIFTNSSNLSATGVTDFCGALCTVALEELSETPAPRLFCIQKIVEMAYYNMDSRTRIQWAKIWDKMNDFFVKTMTHTNRDVAMYSIDALRQLASKFLEKDELSNFAFQKSFLRPFETCYSRAKSVAVRELVLSCISQIVLARANNIKSGWKSVFAVLALAADDHVEALMNFGWQIVDSITRKYVGVLEDVYVDAVMGISAYARTTISTPVSLAALELLSGRCPSSLLAWLDEKEGGGDAEGTPVTKQQQFSGDDDGHIGLWFPILTGLAAAMQDERGAVRLAANNGLFKVLTDHGGRFSPSMWTLIFRGVLSPIFDDVRHLSGCNDKNEAAMVAEWAATTGVTALQSFVDVFVLHLSMTRSILDELLGLIRSWIMQENESVAREGMSILARLAMRAGEVFSSDDWTRVIHAITKTFTDTMPHEIVGSRAGVVGDDKKDNENENRDAGNDGGRNLMARVDSDSNANGHRTDRGGGRRGSKDKFVDGEEDDDEDTSAESKIDFRVVRSKCVVQLLLIEVVQEVVVSFYEQLATPHIVSMSQCLEMSYTFAHKFNADIELRYSLWRTGFMNQVPNLLKQETNGLMAYLRIMFWLYLDGERRGDVAEWSEERVMALCESVLGRYIRACEEAPSKSEERREVAALSPVVLFIVNSVMQMSQAQFEAHLHELYGILLELVDSCDDRQVRLAVTTLLRARVVPTVSLFHPHAQLPGTLATKVLSVKIAADASVQTEEEVCAAVTKVGGVRSVEAIDDRPNCFEVIASAPDEMIVSGALGLPFVKAAFVEVGNLHQVD